jgi:Pro-kumamolisin, activation domain/Bacterial Ig-like domain (group 3)
MDNGTDAPSSIPHWSFIRQSSVSRILVAVIGLAACLGPAVLRAQQGKQTGSIPSLVKQPVNDAQRTILKGNVHPLARPEHDQGLAPDSLSMARMLLVLKRSPQQETALSSLLVGQQDKSSPQYHHWLTPQQFGQEFGPSDSDLQAVTDWLAAQGFQVTRVTNGRAIVEFSGTAGLVRQVFHTGIHKYVVNGKPYWANASDPQIPAALAPVVAGVASLNNFPRRPMYRPVGVFLRSKKDGRIKPLYTIVCPQGYTCSAPEYYAVGPTDFATIYNVLPLWNAGTDGTGETIAIVSDSNINPQDVANFRSMFGLPPKPVNVILDGPDPGIIPGPETEADADVEWAGAVAKNATIDLVVSEDTEATAGVDLSALYIVDNNLAPVLSESYGACESDLGTAGNAFENALWEQAAAEGITVKVATGDNGSAGCDYPGYVNSASNGLAVSGLASTPFNVAVGGTDFANPANYFNTTSDSTTQNSAKSYVPEITWNDSCARSGPATECPAVSSSGQDLVAGAGGASHCAVQDSSGDCSSGYAKPAWQTGTGVPADSLRDIPDVSLFAGDGLDDAFYIVCTSDPYSIGISGPGGCTNDISSLDFLGVGGTSLSAPAFAGIMALVNQKTGQRQGNANFVLYPLAAAAAKNNDNCTSDPTAVSNSGCVFYDIIHGIGKTGTEITPGNNSVACVAGSPNCNAPAGYPYGIMVNPAGSTTPAWTTATGFDLATGLGSINAANLVNNWGSVSFHTSGTTLSLTPTTLTHGQSVSATVSVTSSAGTPTGDVALMGNAVTPANPTGSSNVGIATFKLGSGGAVIGSTNMLPGGTYNVFAHYAGDGTSGSSDSTPPVTVTVNPENSQTQMSFVTYNPATGMLTGSGPTPPGFYGQSLYLLRVDVLNSAGNPCAPTTSNGLQVQPTSGCPTGRVTLTNNGSPWSDFNGSNFASLNSQGYMEDQQIPLLSGGPYSFVASYSGDASFNPSSGTANFTISQAPTTLTVSLPKPATYGGGNDIDAVLNTTSIGTFPTGTFTLFVDGTEVTTAFGGDVLEGKPYLDPPFYAHDVMGTLTTFSTLGAHTVSVQYSGDENYQPATSAVLDVNVTKYQPVVFLMLNPTTIGLGQQTILKVLVLGSLDPPTGAVTFYDGGTAISGTVTYSSTGDSLNATIPYTPTTGGAHNITASYPGNSNYLSATSPITVLTVQTPDFQLISNQSPTIAAPGGSASAQVGISPVDGWTGTVNLTCGVTASGVSAQNMPTCSLNPASVNVGSTQVSTTLTVHSIAPSSAPPAPRGEPPAGRWPLGLWLSVLGLMGTAAIALSRIRTRLGIGAAFRWTLPALLTIVLLSAALWGSCGGGGGSSVTNSGTPAGNYTVTVTGVSGSLQHQVEVTFSVQ